MAVLQNGSKCSHTTCMLRFFTVSRLALNPNLIFEIGSNIMALKALKIMDVTDKIKALKQGHDFYFIKKISTFELS